MAFIARKAEIDAILTCPAALSTGHFDCTPDEASWAEVGAPGSFLRHLREYSNAAFREGKHFT